MTQWRFAAMDAVTREWVHQDIPLSDVEIEYALSGPMSITATISPETHSLQRPDGSPLFDVWGTLIFAEEGNLLRGGGILVDCSYNGQDWDLEVMGFTGYLHKLPLVDTLRWGGSSSGTSGHGVDPLEVVRALWANAQSKPNGNLQVTVDDSSSSYRVGSWHNAARLPTEAGGKVDRSEVNDPIPFAEVLDNRNHKPVAANKKTLYWEYSLPWYENLEMGALIQEFSEKVPFDYVEEYSWADSDKSEVRMNVKIGAPRLGTRKSNLSFAVGDNIYDVLTIQQSGEDYANSVYYYGSGEGSSQLRAESTEVTHRLRRTATHVDTSITSRSDLQALAKSERQRAGIDLDVDSFMLIQHDNAPLGSFTVGDDIYVRSDFGWMPFEYWVRVDALKVNIHTGQMQVSCQRSDGFSYTPTQERFTRP